MLLKRSGGYEARDPWVIYHNGYFYHCFTSNAEKICVTKSLTPEGLLTAEPKVVYIPEENKEYSKELWAPELHVIDGKCYIYVACDDGDNYHHRMYVLENGSNDPTDTYRMAGKVSATTDKWAIDATVFEWKGIRYMMWSGWEGDENVCQNMYIAKMKDPYTICTDRVLISEPEYPWEKMDCDGVNVPYINEGACAYKKDGKLRIFYSGSHSNWNHYCLGMLTLVGDDPMKRGNWVKYPEPVLSQADGLNGPGHCSVFSDGKTDYIAYHVFDDGKTEGWQNVHAEIFPFELNNGKIILK